MEEEEKEEGKSLFSSYDKREDGGEKKGENCYNLEKKEIFSREEDPDGTTGHLRNNNCCLHFLNKAETYSDYVVIKQHIKDSF